MSRRQRRHGLRTAGVAAGTVGLVTAAAFVASRRKHEDGTQGDDLLLDYVETKMPNVLVYMYDARKYWRSIASLLTLLALTTDRGRRWIIGPLLYYVALLCYRQTAGRLVTMVVGCLDVVGVWLMGPRMVYLANSHQRQLNQLAERLTALKRRYWQLDPDRRDLTQQVLADSYDIAESVLRDVLGDEADVLNAVPVSAAAGSIDGMANLLTSGYAPGYLDSKATTEVAACTCKAILALKNRFSTHFMGAVASRKECDGIYRKAFGSDTPLITSVSSVRKWLGVLIPRIETAFDGINAPQLTTPTPGVVDRAKAMLPFSSRSAIDFAIQRTRAEAMERVRSEERMIIQQIEQHRRFAPDPMSLATGEHQRFLQLAALAEKRELLPALMRLDLTGRLPASTAEIMKQLTTV